MDKKTIIEEIAKGAETVVQLMRLGEHEIKVVARRKGYTPPCDGDYARVKVELHLPVGEDGVCLHPEFQYGTRKQLLGEWMYQDWGVLKDGMRVNSCHYFADTWRHAITMCLDEVAGNLEGLLTVMNERQEALKRAEG